MTITIPDDILEQAGLTEREALIEFACRLFDGDRLPLPLAARLAGLERVQMEIELGRRGIPIWRQTIEDQNDDMAALDRLLQEQ
ncbi:MAG: UPF0175 family protein [Phycisphaeraceae bacterium]|nr:UPF0175 family protein [Phycisphaeraceae bacterium]